MGRLGLFLRTTTLLATSFLIAAFALAKAAAYTDIPCERLEVWAVTIDPRDRYQPVEGDRTWAPKSFGAPEFAEAIGKPAMEMAPTEVDALAQRLRACMDAAQKAKRYDARKAMNTARGMLSGRLKKALAAAARAQERAAKATTAGTPNHAVSDRATRDQRPKRTPAESRPRSRQDGAVGHLKKLLAEPDSPDLLHDLALLRHDPPAAKERFRVGRARILSLHLASGAPGPSDPEIAEPIAARIAAMKPAMLTAAEQRIDAAPSSAAGLGDLSAILQASLTGLGPALTEDERRSLVARAAVRRDAIRADITSFAMRNIVNTPETLDGLERLGRWRREVERLDLNPAQRKKLASALAARRTFIADAILTEAAGPLAELPESLDGIARFRALATDLRPMRAMASAEARAAFDQAAADRLAAIRAGALPEYVKRLGNLPANRAGLKQAEAALAEATAAPPATPLRQDYATAAQTRRDAIRADLDAQDRGRREAALAAGGDPRLVGLRFVSTEAGMVFEFRDAERVIAEVLGLRFAGEYEVSKDDVIINGPNGQILLTIGKNVLTGMGMRLERQD